MRREEIAVDGLSLGGQPDDVAPVANPRFHFFFLSAAGPFGAAASPTIRLACH
jgi:hypothetical protein